MRGVIAALLAIGLSLWLSGQALAGGARMTGRSGQPRVSLPVTRVPAAPIVKPNFGYAHPLPGYFYKRPQHYYYPPYYRHRAPLIIVAPTFHYPYYYSYYSPATLLLNAPFYCFIHHEGFVTRVGFIDHISGAHKVPLQTAVSVCPEGDESCVIEGY